MRRFAGCLALGACILAPQASRADRAIAAGGCDPVGGENDQETRFVDDAFKTARWKTDRLFGDHFTEQSLLGALDPSRFASGEKLFINIRTHGDDSSGHQICLWDPAKHKNVYVPISDFKAALDRLVQEKHVKIAVADGSCYGGGSIRQLAGPGVCVMSSTYADTTSFGTSIGASVAARVAALKASPAAARALLARHSTPSFSYAALTQSDPELDGRPGTSIEELFLASRAFRGYSDSPNNHRAAQISSDVEESGPRMSRELALGLGFKNDEFNSSGSTESVHLRRAFSQDLFSAGMACDPDNPFPAIDRIVAGFSDAGDRARAEDVARRLGFESVADAYSRMRSYYNQRRANYQQWVQAAGELNAFNDSIGGDPDAEAVRSYIRTGKRIAVLEDLVRRCEQALSPAYQCDPDATPGTTRDQQLADLRDRLTDNRARQSRNRNEIEGDAKLSGLLSRYQAIDQRYRDALDRDNRITDSGEYMRMEKVFYEVRYLQQRQRTADDPKARACSDFVL